MKSNMDGKIHCLLKKYVKEHRGWSLCIGSGASNGFFPDWTELVELLIKEVDIIIDSKPLLNNIKSKFSLDAIIQAAFEKMDISEDEFSKLLSKLLYSKLKSILKDNEFDIFLKVFASSSMDKIKKQDWKSFIKIRETYFKKTTAYTLAKIISEIIGTDLCATEIMTFNAEPLLFTLINSFIFEKNIRNTGKINDNIGKYLSIATRSISPIRNDTVPYYFIHGFLPIPQSDNNIPLFSVDKLVFSELEYLELANNSYSWQSSIFMNICSSKPVVFVGVSLSDSNMRRWLGWLRINRYKEISLVDSKKKESTLHYWLELKPKEESVQKWIESCVAHLGVRIIWLDNWNEIEYIFREMLNIH